MNSIKAFPSLFWTRAACSATKEFASGEAISVHLR
jgi:hypothetical protein